MAKLEVQIGADSSELNAEISAAESKIKRLAAQKSINLKLGVDNATLNRDITAAKGNLANLKKSVDSTSDSFAKMKKPVQNGGNTLMQFSRIAQDAPFGIMGIGNNITATAESFGYLAASSGGAGNALKAVASSMLGVGGILLAVSLVTSALTYMSQNGITVGDVFKKLTGDFDLYADALKRTNDQSYKDEGVQKAISNVQELTINIGLAKDGFLDKEKVVDQYNETIGKTTGLVDTLDEAEQQIVKNGDAYIKMTLYKAAAQLALQEAAKKSLEAEKTRAKKLDEFTNSFLDADLTQTRSAEQYNAKQENLKKQLANRKKEELKISQDAANANLSIAKKFQEDAAKIAKDFNFNLFGDTKKDKSAADKRPKLEAIAPLISIDNEKLKAEGKKVIKVFEDSLGSELERFKSTPIVLDIPLQPELPPEPFNSMLDTLEDFNTAATDIIKGSIADTFAGIGEAIGSAMSTGANIAESLGQVLLGSFGMILTELGKLLIKTGVGLLIAKLALESVNPYLAIAGGIALVAAGAAFSSGSKSIGGSISSGGGGGSGSSGGGVSTGGSYSAPSGGSYATSSGGGGTVVFEISGQSLIGVLSNTLDRNSRLGGSLGIG